MQKFLTVGGAIVGFLAAASAARGNPVYTLTLQDSGGTISQTDNGTGVITYSGTLGGFTISDMTVQDLSQTNPLDVDFGSQDIFKATGADSLKVFVTVSNLPATVPAAMTIGTTSQANFEGSHIMGWSAQTYYDPGNDTGLAGLVDLLSKASGGSEKNGFLKTSTGTTMLTGSPFSYTVEYVLDLQSNQFANGAGSSTDVLLPEPGSALLLMAGLASLGLIRCRYRHRTMAAHTTRGVPGLVLLG
jgi:hypothetical protein